MTLNQAFFFILTIQIIGLASLVGRFVLACLVGARVDSVWIFLGRARWEFLAFKTVVVSVGWFPVGCGMKLLDFRETSLLDARMSPRRRILQQIFIHAGLLPTMLGTSAVLLTISLWLYGEQAQTLQVTNVREESFAHHACIERGDVLLKVNQTEIQSFEEGQKLLKEASEPLELTWQRRTGWVNFSTIASFQEWLDKRYEAPNYIRVELSSEKEQALFYSVEEARSWLNTKNLAGAQAGVSTTATEFSVQWDRSRYAELGVGIKPFSLSSRLVRHGLVDSMRGGFAYTGVLFSLIMKHSLNLSDFRLSFLDLTDELTRFVQEVSSMDLISWVRLLAVFCVFWAFLNLLPFPGLALWSIVVLGFKLTTAIPAGMEAGTTDA